jgi:hypothetical protein
MGRICSACRPRKCAGRRSPHVRLQSRNGRPGALSPPTTPTEFPPLKTITPPMADAPRKISSPVAIPH